MWNKGEGREWQKDNNPIVFVPTFLCSHPCSGNTPPLIAVRCEAAVCPTCHAPFKEYNGGTFCSQCGINYRGYEIPGESCENFKNGKCYPGYPVPKECRKTDCFCVLAAMSKTYFSSMKAAKRQIMMLDVSVSDSNYETQIMQKRRSDFIDYRIITLFKSTGNGSVFQSDIPKIFSHMFVDNTVPAKITLAQVRASVERLRENRKVVVEDISTPQGKRIIVKLLRTK
jgi:hypothetical protein